MLDNMMQYQDQWNFGIDITERVAPRIIFPNMLTWGDWDYDNLPQRTRNPRNDSRTLKEAREYFMLNPSGEMRFEQSAGDRCYSQYMPRASVTDAEAERHMNETRRTI